MPEAVYILLPDSEEAKFQAGSDSHPRRRRPNLWFSLSMSLNIVFAFAFLGWSYRAFRHSERIPTIYSPAQSVIVHKLVKFHRGQDGTGDIPLYEQEPSDEVDQAWRALYDHPELRVPKSEAVKMVNATYPILNDPGNYILSLEMFHQIHCLDKLRHQLHPERGYPSYPQSHIRHCIGAIRQALMCYADVTPVVMQWSDAAGQAIQRDDIVHQCRDYSKIKHWADEHRMKRPAPDLSVYIESELN
ncbi:hypothetical protein C8F01DRAFT_1336806 [Mycena amicta]|nr:hypothetical protein C8F01DRAFT_1336806 [Mycena amicta]